MDPHRVVVLASGNGTDLQSILDAIASRLIQLAKVTLVLSDNPAAGALERAQLARIPSFAFAGTKAEGGRAARERAFLSAIDRHGGTDLVVLAGYMRLLSPSFVDTFAGRLVNVHPALLPAFAGLDGPGDALASGARIAGCTTHFVDHGIDTGPIILQGAVRVHATDTRDTLQKRILALEHQILPRTVDLVTQGRIVRDGRRVSIQPGDTWHGRVPPLAEVLYPEGF